MTVESSTQAICDLALRFGEGDEESMVSIIYVTITSRTQARLIICRLHFIPSTSKYKMDLHQYLCFQMSSDGRKLNPVQHLGVLITGQPYYSHNVYEKI